MISSEWFIPLAGTEYYFSKLFVVTPRFEISCLDYLGYYSDPITARTRRIWVYSIGI
jgi:hypothetical protein